LTEIVLSFYTNLKDSVGEKTFLGSHPNDSSRVASKRATGERVNLAEDAQKSQRLLLHSKERIAK
jgi:hypothetical protein